MKRSGIVLGVAVLIVVLHGVLHGWSTGRWSSSDEPMALARRLANVPLDIGHWHGEPLKLDARRQATANIGGYVLRRYVHRRTKTTLSVLLVCGWPGPIAVHTPDVCYRGAGFQMVKPQEHRTINASAEFWYGEFRRRGEAAGQLRIWWAWNDGNGWQAPEHPRFHFGGSPALFKLYVVQESAVSGAADNGVAESFLCELLPVLNSTLFPER